MQIASIFKNYSNIILLLIGIFVGSIFGIFLPETVSFLKPVGDIFLNLLFVTVVPMVYFAVAHSIANVSNQGNFGKTIFAMIFTFLLFIVIAALYAIGIVYLFPTEALGSNEMIDLGTETATTNLGDKIVNFFTVSEFINLFSRQNMLALLVFAFLTGTAVRRAGERGEVFKSFLASGY